MLRNWLHAQPSDDGQKPKSRNKPLPHDHLRDASVIVDKSPVRIQPSQLLGERAPRERHKLTGVRFLLCSAVSISLFTRLCLCDTLFFAGTESASKRGEERKWEEGEEEDGGLQVNICTTIRFNLHGRTQTV